MPFYQSRIKAGHFLTFEKTLADGWGFSFYLTPPSSFLGHLPSPFGEGRPGGVR
jgi:hypothetical protein